MVFVLQLMTRFKLYMALTYVMCALFCGWASIAEFVGESDSSQFNNIMVREIKWNHDILFMDMIEISSEKIEVICYYTKLTPSRWFFYF